MHSLESVPESVQRSIVFGILLYFTLIVYAEIANEPLAGFAADIVFAFVAITVGVLLFTRATDRLSPLSAGGLCLLVGGIAQLIAVFTGELLLHAVASMAVFVGIGLYILAVWLET
ncbi:hypothetical protein ACLI4U_16715 [Natrialbaceae archaeon A-CW2]|uniref:hypothetical protein n=1 Tax=Natronosalvus amylolyticus TaxID=2961994 RepID=UPI0020C99C76|nr:hypothetical protein [Natronosalvus amylolyticus]